MRFDHYFKVLAEKFQRHQALYFQAEQETIKHSYQELDERTTKIASYLSSLGIQEGMCVGVFCENRLIYPLVFLACAKMGAIYVPINVQTDDQKIRPIITNAEMAFLVTEEKLLNRVHSFYQAKIIDTRDLLNHQSNDFIEPKANNPILYLIYSSGTTNEPKGIPIAQDGMVYWSDYLESTIKTPSPHVLGNTSVGFDPHIWEFIMAWGTGGCLYLTDIQTHQSEKLLQHFMLEHNITDATFTPKLFNLFINEDNGNFLQKLYQAGLRRLYLTGEALSPQILKQCDEARITLYNCFGPSELTFGLSMKEVHSSNVDNEGSVEIGFPPMDKQIFTFLRRINETTESIEPLSRTETAVGELLVSSPYMTPGYYRNTQLTHSNFFTVKHGDREFRTYKTADMVQVIAGKLYFRGRISDRVKRNYIFINLEEIRVAINRYLNDLTILFDVILITEADKDYLFAFISKDLSVDEIKKSILTQLSKNEVPDHIIYLEDYPLNVNRKSDKVKLKNYATEYVKKYLKHTPNKAFKPKDDLSQLEEDVSAALHSLFNEIKPEAESFFADKNVLVRDYFTESIDWIRFLSRLRRFFEQDISSDLLKSLTFRQLQIIITRAYLLNASCIFPNDNAAQNQYVFCIPPVTGDIQAYMDLIPTDLRSVLMLSPTLNPVIYKNEKLSALCREAFENMTLDELAAAHVACIKLIQKEGPYHVLGWSFGGCLILALLKANLKIDNPLLIDAPHPDFLRQLSKDELKNWLINFAKYLFKQYKLEDDVYLPLLEKISLELKDLSEKEFINVFFDNLTQSLNKEIPLYLINMLQVAKNNMLSVYNFSLTPAFKIPRLTILHSQHGLMGKQICLPDNWQPHVQQLSSHMLDNTDHFNIIQSPDLKEFISKMTSQPLSTVKNNEEEILLELSDKIPYLSPTFIDREDLFDKISVAFKNKSSQAMRRRLVNLTACTGLAGVGKTEMAKCFALYQKQYRYRFWFEAETPSKLYAEYQALGRALRGKPEENPEELIEYIKRVFNKRENWLIVYDNAESPAVIENYLPQIGGDILVTSRVAGWENYVEVDVFNEEQAINYFLKNHPAAHTDIDILRDLVHELDRLPLALAQACAYINAHSTFTVKRYLKEFREKRLKYLEDPTMPSFCKHGPVAFTWKMTVDALLQNQDAIFILNCLSYLYPSGIEIEYLADLFAPKGQKAYVKSADFALRCQNAIDLLAKYFLVRLSEDKKTIAIHRLVQLVMWENQRIEGTNLDYLQSVLESIFRSCTEKADSLVLAGVALTKECLQDIIHCYERMLLSNPDDPFILQALGCCNISSNFEKAESCFLQVIRTNPSSAIYFEYGHVLFIRGEFKKAIAILEKSIQYDDNRASYFSEMEVNIVDEKIAAEIKKNGVVTANSRSFSYLFLIRCYLMPEHYQPKKAMIYITELSKLLIKYPSFFIENTLNEIRAQIPQDNKLGNVQTPTSPCALL